MIEKCSSADSPKPLEIVARGDENDVFMDLSFSVPYRHRVWFCENVFDPQCDILKKCFDDGDRNRHDLEQDSAKVQIWIDNAVADCHPEFLHALTAWIAADSKLQLTRAPEFIGGGETCKNDWRIVQNLLGAINDDQLDRRSYIVVIGGGAVLDVVGYAAAVAHRGIRLIRFPSTTLAQADSGVGVKNAVNEFGKKNWKGTFAVPWAVVNDYSLLDSLPTSTFVSGFSEAVKVALLKSPASFNFLCDNADEIRARDPSTASHAIQESAIHHLRHIAQGGDPFELMEARPLDFGHWLAHKIEALSDYGITHGDAVSLGLAVDVLYSVEILGLESDTAERVIGCLRRLGLPVWDPLLDRQRRQLLAGLEEFRQHLGGRLTVTMLAAVGRPVNIHEIDHQAVDRAIDALKGRSFDS